jgi:UDP-2,4-diacetamido-2,4,6-trideoxy-beta-L-altropyranose hydrolase
LQRDQLKVAIRVDASSQIGTGHFMRCLTLADALRQRGAQIRFVSRRLPEHLKNMLTAKEHQFMPLDGRSTEANADDLAHAHWLGTSQHADAQESIRVLSDQAWDWLIVDHYALDARWESALRQTASRFLAVDDLADRQHDCDFLLDPNFYSDMDTRYVGRVPAHCTLLLGPRYSLLHDEFRRLRERAKPRTGPVKRVLVFFGGVDADNYSGRALEALISLGVEGLHIDCVIGEKHPRREQIESVCAEHQFACHVQTSCMAELMAAADLAIGAGGSATWERCCLGLPTFSICTADNQIRQVADAASEGWLYAPEIKNGLTHAIKRHLCALLENDCLRRAISRNAMQAVDGRGVLRLIGSMGCNDITMRLASWDDSRKIFEWRNHLNIRQVSRNSGVITWEDHQEWFAAALTLPDRLLLIGQRAGVPVGVVRFDIEDMEAEVSIYVVPDINELGLGRDLLQTAERWLSGNRPGVGKVNAHVLGSNERSMRLFLGTGYQGESACFSKRLHHND